MTPPPGTTSGPSCDRSGLNFKLRVRDVRVQGDGADAGIAEALADLAEPGGGQPPVDVIVLIRGGGARTDLATFDSELVARAIAGAGVPVLTGLGHEIDRSVADEVAHTALKTPTACAGALIERVQAYRRQVERTWSAVALRAVALAARAESRLTVTTKHISQRTSAAVGLSAVRLDHHAQRLARVSSAVLAASDRRLDDGSRRLVAAGPRRAAGADRDLDGLEARVRALDPVRTLARGWSITRRADGATVRSAADVGAGDELVTTLADGTVRSRVEPEADR